MAVTIIDTLKQKNNVDFGIVDSNDIIGGFYQADTVEERNSIPEVRRKEGMFCWVGGTVRRVYQLVGGITNSDWIEFKSGTSESGGSTIDGYAHIWVGTEPPEDTSMIWLDTNEDGVIEDNEDDMQILVNLVARIEELENTIASLTERVAYLEENGVSSPDTGITSSYDAETRTLTLESSSIRVVDGNLIINNSSSSVSDGNLNL